jgi:hypothetical protein
VGTSTTLYKVRSHPYSHCSMSTAATLSANAGSTSGSRSRPQARKKPNDDAAYFGATGMKRQAVDRAEGESRSKRKRLDGSAVSRKAEKSTADDDYKSSVRGSVDPATFSLKNRFVRLTSKSCLLQGYIATSTISISFHPYIHHL